MSRPRRRQVADPAAVVAELREVAEEMVTDDDIAEWLPFGWDEEHARDVAADRHHRRLVREWEADHRTSLSPPDEPAPVLVDGVDVVRTRTELGVSHG